MRYIFGIKMKHNNMNTFRPIIVIAAAALIMSSCSTIKEKYLVITGKQGNELSATPVESAEKKADSETINDTKPAVDPSGNTKKDTSKKSSEKNKEGKNHSEKHPESQKQNKIKPIGNAIDGQWNVVEVGTTKIELEEDVPYVTFDAASGSIYAFNGCNYLNGKYTLTDSNKISFGKVLSTMKYCADVPFDSEINAVVSDGTTLDAELKRIGQDSYLYLRSDRGRTVMTLRRHNMEFLNGNWLVTSIDGKAIDDEEANVFFDIHELKIHGNTGCNFFNGDIYIDPNRSNAIDFSKMGVTRMACPKTAQETAMLVALESTASAIAGRHESTVLLLDKNGKELMTLRRIPHSGE
jgi:heat shock protein HslJ